MTDSTSTRRERLSREAADRAQARTPYEAADRDHPGHYACRPFDRAKMHDGPARLCIICALPKATTYPVPGEVARTAWLRNPGPWTPPGSVVIDGVTIVPGARGLERWRRLAAADTAEIYGRAMGARSSHAVVEHIAADGTREVVDEATWSREMTDTYGPGILAAYDRDQVRVRSVFELAQARRWELAQIQSPAVRDALSLT